MYGLRSMYVCMYVFTVFYYYCELYLSLTHVLTPHKSEKEACTNMPVADK